jgi:hypothetical protein
VKYRAMMKSTYEKYGQGCEFHAVLARAKVRRQCHLADVELELPDHAPERMHEYRDFFKLQCEALRSDCAVF